MIRYYIFLQFKMMLRKIREFGLHPILAFLICCGLAIILHYSFLSKLTYGDWFVFSIPLFVQLNIINPQKLEFLQIHLDKKSFYKIRILENSCISIIPFIYLVCIESFLKAFILFFMTILFAFFSFHIKSQKVFPTPFSRYLYEYAIGFRKTIWIYPFSLMILMLSFYTKNHYIAIFAWLIIMFTTLNYYSYPDEEYYIWNFRSTANRFLLIKIFQAFYYTTLLSLPFLLIFILFTEIELLILWVLFIVISLLQIIMILSRYASYPNQIQIPYLIISIVCLLFPPMFLFFTPYLFLKAKNKLIPILQ